jgi:hypothetical protein
MSGVATLRLLRIVLLLRIATTHTTMSSAVTTMSTLLLVLISHLLALAKQLS